MIPNVSEEARIFEWAGVSFGEEETFKLAKALKVSCFALTRLEIGCFEWSLKT